MARKSRVAQKLDVTLPLPDDIFFIEMNEYPGAAQGKEIVARVEREATGKKEYFTGDLPKLTESGNTITITITLTKQTA